MSTSQGPVARWPRQRAGPAYAAGADLCAARHHHSESLGRERPLGDTAGSADIDEHRALWIHRSVLQLNSVAPSGQGPHRTGKQASAKRNPNVLPPTRLVCLGPSQLDRDPGSVPDRDVSPAQVGHLVAPEGTGEARQKNRLVTKVDIAMVPQHPHRLLGRRRRAKRAQRGKSNGRNRTALASRTSPRSCAPRSAPRTRLICCALS